MEVLGGLGLGGVEYLLSHDEVITKVFSLHHCTRSTANCLEGNIETGFVALCPL